METFLFKIKNQGQKRNMETFLFKFKNKVKTLGAIPQTPFFFQYFKGGV